MTQAIINNLEILRAAVAAQPEDLFNLSHYKRDTPCGTLFCTAGLATTLPHFQELGFHIATEAFVGDGSTAFTGVAINEEWIFDDGVADAYFGPRAMDNLFHPSEGGDIDEEVGYEVSDTNEANMTDKELAVARLDYQLNLMKEQA